MYRIRNATDNDLNVIRLENENEDSFVSIVPEIGANVNEICLERKGKKYSILDGNHSRQQFEGRRMFNNAHLVPFPNRVRGGAYRVNGKEYMLVKNYQHEGNAAHGFIYNRPFQIISRKEEEDFAEVISHHSYNGSSRGYPFPFEITYTYSLDARDGFVCSFVVTNSGDETMPFGAGWHPYFTFGQDVRHLQLQIPKVFHLPLDNNKIPTGEEHPEKRFEHFREIGDLELDTLYRFDENSDKHIVRLFNAQEECTIQLWMEANSFKFCQLYIPPDRRSIAVEPMTCAVDAFNNGKGLVFIEPGKTFKGSFGVQLK